MHTPCSVKSVEYLRFIFISLGSPFVAFEMDILKLTKGCLMSEKIEPKSVCYNLPGIKICGAKCNA